MIVQSCCSVFSKEALVSISPGTVLQDPKSQLEQDVGNDKPLARKTTFKQSQVILYLPDTRGSKLLVLCYSALKNIMTDCRHASNKLAELVPFQFVQDKTGFRKLLPTTAGEFDFLLPSLHVRAMSHWPRRLSGAANSLYILSTAAMWEASGVRWFAHSSYVFEQLKRAVLLHTDPSHRRLAYDLEALSGSSLQPS